jgi:meso-butanediol dehydrogenase / (S,S)-butanediol dehydrogenase / diacetyl reductase
VSADVRAALAQAQDKFGGLDAIIHCAGTIVVGAVADTDDASWLRLLHTNLDTAFVTARRRSGCKTSGHSL